MVEAARCASSAAATWRIEISGRVQGVGFRPFIFCLAEKLGVTGEVCNELGTVRVLVTGEPAVLHEFGRCLISDAPPLARPVIQSCESHPAISYSGFSILASRASKKASIFVPPDGFCCDDCLNEMSDPDDRRFRYPFINCTQCGPRYTLIEALPYDRPNTTMASFPLCAECEEEYLDPRDRRFHAEPIACPECGPQLSFYRPGETAIADSRAAIVAAAKELHAGGIVATKGIGGYHLMCDAGNSEAIERLRRRKCRPSKPLAVMFPLAGPNGLGQLQQSVMLADCEAELVRSSARPIVLAERRADCPLSDNLATGLNELGVFLPYSPMHALLLNDFGAPLVATSGNISGEPVLTDNAEAERRLSGIADAYLHHNRGIARPADDPVYRRIDERLRPLRVGRGDAPIEMTLPWHQGDPVICVGGQQKVTVTLSWEDRAVVSPHIGDLTSPRSLAVFEQVIADLQSLYAVEARRIICDAHKGYTSSRWANQQALPVNAVWHHHAHASALVAEHAAVGNAQQWLVFTWDGVGLGDDGSLWGGEALLGNAGYWTRVGSFRPFSPPGGDRAGREPWRSAAALCWEVGEEPPFNIEQPQMAHAAWQQKLNSPATTAVGRLFDAAAALVSGTLVASFEAEGPMMLESLCKAPGQARVLPMSHDTDGVLRTDWALLLPLLADTQRPPADRAEDFHSTMARVVVDQAIAIRELHGVNSVGLSGGVFQNRVLTEQAASQLRASGFSVYMHTALPCNDAGLSFGQAAEWAAKSRGRTS